MITNYTAMLSMGKAQVMQHDGTFVECDMVYGDRITLAIKGAIHEFLYYIVSLDGNTWRRDAYLDRGDGVGYRNAVRLLINRFLQVVPSSKPTVRMHHLLQFLSKPASLHHASSIRLMINRRMSRLKRTPFGQQSIDVHAYNHYIPRKHKFSDRQRDYFRLVSPKSVSLKTLVNHMVNSYSGYCSDFSNGSSEELSQWGKGWTLRFSDMKIIGYTSDGLERKSIDLAPLNIHSRSLVALSGIRNVFCAEIVEQTEDTAMLRVYGKNSKPKGYICVNKKDNGVTFRDPEVHLDRSHYTADDIGNTRGEAIARMLARG